MKAIIIRVPFWLGLIGPALLIRYDLPNLISVPTAYLIGFAASNLAFNILSLYKKAEENKRTLELNKDRSKW